MRISSRYAWGWFIVVAYTVLAAWLALSLASSRPPPTKEEPSEWDDTAEQPTTPSEDMATFLLVFAGLEVAGLVTLFAVGTIVDCSAEQARAARHRQRMAYYTTEPEEPSPAPRSVRERDGP